MTTRVRRPSWIRTAKAQIALAGILPALAILELALLLAPTLASDEHSLRDPTYALHVQYLPLPTSNWVESGVFVHASLVAFAGMAFKNNGRDQVYIGNLRNWKPRWLFQSSKRLPELGLSGLSARWLVWVQYDRASDWAIYARNLVSGRRYTIDTSARTHSRPPP